MYIGHYAVALAAKRVAPRASLGTLILAAMLLDTVFPIFLALGIEEVVIAPGHTVVMPLAFPNYPLSHSLFSAVILGLLFAGTHYAFRRSRIDASVLGACVVSHWILDFISHAPDLPISLWSMPDKGLGLWNSLAGTLVIEVGLFAAGLTIYLRTTRATNRTGRYAFWGLIVFLLATYFPGIFGPPPPSETAVMVTMFLAWLLIPWGYWIDRNRVTD